MPVASKDSFILADLRERAREREGKMLAVCPEKSTRQRRSSAMLD